MKSSQRWTLYAAILGSAIVFLDSTVVNVALPRIGQTLPRWFVGVLEGQSYVYNGYLLTLSALLILAGGLSDSFGRKRMFQIGLIGFGATSILCGTAPTMELLVVFRIFQGVFGAILVPGSLALITVTFSGEAQGKAFGTWAAATAGTTLLGPFVGGLLVAINWRLVFFINIPLVLLGVLLLRKVEESHDANTSRKFHWAGAALVAAACGGLAFGAIFGAQHNWDSPAAVVALLIGVVSTVAIPWVMQRTSHPLIPLNLFRSRQFTVTNISTFLIYGAIYVSFYYIALFAQGVLNYSPAAAGLAGIPGTVLLVMFSSRVGKLSARFGPRWFMTIGPLIMACGILWLVRISPTSNTWNLSLAKPASLLPPLGYWTDLFPAFVVFGAGFSILVAPLTTALMTSVPSDNSAVASAINNAISRIGPQLAGAAIFVAITAVFYSGLHQAAPALNVSATAVRAQISPLNRPTGSSLFANEQSVVAQQSADAFHLAMLVSAAILLAGAAVNGVGIPNKTRS